MKTLMMAVLLTATTTITYAQKSVEKTTECVFDNGILKSVEVEYNPATRNKTIMVNGTRQLLDKVYPLYGKGYAGNESWFKNDEAIVIQGKRYAKSGLPRVISNTDITKLTDYKNAAVFVEQGTTGLPDVVYIAAQRGCEFQPYQKALPPCNVKVKITPAISSIKEGTNLVLNAITEGSKEKLEYIWWIYEADADGNDKEGDARFVGSRESKSVTIATKNAKGHSLDIGLSVNINGKECEPATDSRTVEIK